MGIGSNLLPKTTRTKQTQCIKQPFKVGNEQKKTVISERRETNEVSLVMFPSHHLESFQTEGPWLEASYARRRGDRADDVEAG